MEDGWNQPLRDAEEPPFSPGKAYSGLPVSEINKPLLFTPFAARYSVT